jgi:hypothetical protein
VEKPASQQKPSTHRYALATILFAAALCLSPTPAHPQGCTQCQDNTAATPPKTQAAYRHAIILLTVTAGGLFLTTLILLKRYR